MKKIILTILMAMTFTTSVFANTTSIPKTVFVDNEKKENTILVSTIEGKTYVPIRDFVDAIGAELAWNPNTKEIDITKNNNKYSIKANSTVATVNENKVNASLPPISLDGVTLVPATYILDVFGVNLNMYKNVVAINNKTVFTANDFRESAILIDEAISHLQVK